MRRKLVVGNWKMHGTLADNARLLGALKANLQPHAKVGYAVCVPYPYLQQAADSLRGSAVEWGAQNASEHDTGAYTGEVSAAMVKDFGCRFCIVGHSERRALYGESDELVARKFAAVLRNGLTPVLCIGETLDERERGQTESVLQRQLEAVLSTQGVDAFSRCVVAYEPVWAIGTGRTATPAQAQSAHEFVRGLVARRNAAIGADLIVLYGGSMKPGNAGELCGQTDVDGGLVGGASLVADDFLGICRAAAQA